MKARSKLEFPVFHYRGKEDLPGLVEFCFKHKIYFKIEQDYDDYEVNVNSNMVYFDYFIVISNMGEDPVIDILRRRDFEKKYELIKQNPCLAETFKKPEFIPGSAPPKREINA